VILAKRFGIIHDRPAIAVARPLNTSTAAKPHCILSSNAIAYLARLPAVVKPDARLLSSCKRFAKNADEHASSGSSVFCRRGPDIPRHAAIQRTRADSSLEIG